ncbi:hypothetical protein [uncultured Psychroserpens sp.]|uniref:hypothetical protein n=1 Tax=uncultured Psychroserpens sp. TaxID=255436 RepID=UPI00263A2EF7|nr:hypothetical protein [uncultured Psychroserpens sp.]
MKTLKMLVLVVVITFSSALSASTDPIKTVEPNPVEETISKLLKNPSFEFTEGLTADVEITINENNEMVVLSVDTKNKAFDSFIKNRLNYKKLSKEVISYQRRFKFPVTLTKKR